MSIRSSRTFTFSPPGDTRYPQERTSELVHTVRDLMDRYGSIVIEMHGLRIEFASEFDEGIRLVAEGTSSRPSLTQNPDRTWTFCERWCRTCGRAGAEFLTEHPRRTAYV